MVAGISAEFDLNESDVGFAIGALVLQGDVWFGALKVGGVLSSTDACGEGDVEGGKSIVGDGVVPLERKKERLRRLCLRGLRKCGCLRTSKRLWAHTTGVGGSAPL